MVHFPPTRRGYNVFEVVSAFQKAVRRSNVHDAMYWGTELWRSGYQEWLWRRMSTIINEDVSPDALITAEFTAIREMHRKTRTKANLAKSADAGALEMLHAVVLVANAKKSRVVQWGKFAHFGDQMERLEIPDEAIDQHTQKGRRMQRGVEHFHQEAARLIQPQPGLLEHLELRYAPYYPEHPEIEPTNAWGELRGKAPADPDED